MSALPNLDPTIDNIHPRGARNLLLAVVHDAAIADHDRAVHIAHRLNLLTDDQLEHAWNTGADPLQLIGGAA